MRAVFARCVLRLSIKARVEAQEYIYIYIYIDFEVYEKIYLLTAYIKCDIFAVVKNAIYLIEYKNKKMRNRANVIK